MRAWVEASASQGDSFATVLLDLDDFDKLDGRVLSIGSHGYAQMWNRPGVILLHRWIMGVPVGTQYRAIVDHINRNPLDCRRANLRIVTATESNLNRGISSRELPRGVYRTPAGRFAAAIKRHRKVRHLGTYGTPEDAALAVESARQSADVSPLGS
ncbi:HNH endonuclease [Embleya sp. NPDC059237]|uniref:HNH endonuclease n=1 Tax=Embleya sp. NPDC059237 TaxID=3346784 RepID=UPI003680267E